MCFKKSTTRNFLIVSIFVYATSLSQNLYIASEGVVSVTAGDALYVNGNLTVNSNGSLVLNSDASSSASLILAKDVTTSGNITYKRYIDDTDWHIISAPVSLQSIPTFVADSNNGIAQSGNKYAVSYYKNSNPSGQRWVYHVTSSPSGSQEEVLTNFEQSKGYAMMRNAAGVYTFTGTTTASDVDKTLSTSSGTHYWHGVGNPFPSFMAANNEANNSYNVLKKNINKLDSQYAALYVWKESQSQYSAINHSTTNTDKLLAPAQGFMVKMQDDSEVFTFEKDATSHQEGSTTFNRGQVSTTPTIIVRLSVGNMTKSTTLKYIHNCTLGLDPGYDAGAYQDGTPSLAISTHLVADSQGTDFTLQCLPESALETVVIPLSVYAQANDVLTFSSEVSNVSIGTDLYIEDRDTNTFETISNGMSNQVTVSSALEGIGRFYLHTSSSTLDSDDLLNDNNISIYSSSRENLRIVGVENGTANVQIYDILGKEVLRTSFEGTGMNDIQLPNLREGVYIVQLATTNKKINKKIILQ